MNSVLKCSKLLTSINKRYAAEYSRVVVQGITRKWSDDNNYFRSKFLLSTAVACVVGYSIYEKRQNYVYAQNHGHGKNQKPSAGEFRSDLPTYSSREVIKHKTIKNRIWVTYKEGVYDITDFIEGHPGGDQILLAAGSSLEPFWSLYAIHENEYVYEILETLRIGNLKSEDVADRHHGSHDPYANDPRRHPVLRPASQKPFNAEVPPSLLVDSFITPNDFFYVRNHLPVPEIDLETYELEVEIEGKVEVKSFSLEDLKKLPKHTITATIMCAGNRRSEMMKVKPVKGLSWGIAAVGTAKWTGVRLRDLLILCGLENEENFNHVQFEGTDTDVTGNMYGASIPLWKAIDKRCDVLLAYEMNGVPIPPDHGFPVRLIVPGVVGARNVKWLGRIIVSKDESCSHWQQNDYKCFSPSTNWDTVDYSKAPAIQELPVTSAICKPSDGETVKVLDGHICLKGYAWAGGGLKIIRVDLTADEGKTWHVADLDEQDSAEPPQHWAWTIWNAKIPVTPEQKQVELWVKAVDSCYNTQPESFENIWNLRGVLSNAYHRIKVKLEH